MKGGDGTWQDVLRASAWLVVTSVMRPLSGPPYVSRRSGPLVGGWGKRGPARGRRRYPYEAQGAGHLDLSMGRVTAQE